ncbi:hypothetical protein NPS01_23060 [Nocardioides psychrotolerans]|nr:hypothetical protein NPS01_23060 [Nocardioides psychrotolerans]
MTVTVSPESLLPPATEHPVKASTPVTEAATAALIVFFMTSLFRWLPDEVAGIVVTNVEQNNQVKCLKANIRAVSRLTGPDGETARAAHEGGLS